MGLDAVEIVIRTEEVFGISIADKEAASVRSVGDLYRLICSKLDVNALEQPTSSAKLPTLSEDTWRFLFLAKTRPLAVPPEVLPWSPQSVWDTTVALLMDQQQLRMEEIQPEARFLEDLGVD